MIKRAINQRIISYGDECQQIIFKSPHYVYESQPKNGTRDAVDERRDDSLLRTRVTLYRLIHSNIFQHGNYSPVFLTLTYRHNVTSLKSANNDFRYFLKTLNRRVSQRLKYVCIPEFQKRGAVHYHVLFFNLPFIQKQQIEKLWGHGFTRIELGKNIDNLAAYMAKYLTKEILDSRYKGHRLLLTSKGLLRPKIYDNEDVSLFQMTTIQTKFISKIQTPNKIIITYRYAIRKNN